MPWFRVDDKRRERKRMADDLRRALGVEPFHAAELIERLHRLGIDIVDDRDYQMGDPDTLEEALDRCLRRREEG